MESRRKKVLGFGIVFAVGVLGIGAAAVGCGRSFHRHPDPEKVEKYVLWKVNDRLDDLDVNNTQRQVVVAATKSIIGDLRQMKEEHKDDTLKYEILSELERGKPDAEKYHKLLDEKLQLWKDFAHRSMDKALKAFMVLNKEQRKELIEEAREHIEDHS